MKQKLPERRRFVRIGTPLTVKISSDGREEEVVASNVSPVGLRFEIGRALKESERLNMSLYLPLSKDPIRLEAKVIWQTKTSLEDNAPYDVGVEITGIEDKCKNIFLKFLCDSLYSSAYEARA